MQVLLHPGNTDLMHKNSRIEQLPTESSRSNTHVELKKPKGIGIIRVFFSVASVISPKWTIKKALELFIKPRIRAKHSYQDELLKSVIRHDLKFEDKIVRVYEWKGGPKKAVLLHGWESRATALRNVVPGLINLGYTVYGIDAPAHGESSGKITNAKEYGEIIYKASLEYGPFELALIHSFGGLALSYALVEIPGFNVPKVIMLGQPATTKLALKSLYQLLKLKPEIQKGVEDIIHHVSGYAVEDFSVANLSKDFKNTKGLLFHDNNDNLVPIKIALEVVENWNDSRLYITSGLGHFRLIKSKAVLSKIEEWIIDQDN